MLQKYFYKIIIFFKFWGRLSVLRCFNVMLRALVRDFFLTLAVDILSSPERIRCSNEQLSQCTIRLPFFVCPSVVLSVVVNFNIFYISSATAAQNFTKPYIMITFLVKPLGESKTLFIKFYNVNTT